MTLKPSLLLLLGHGENSLFEIDEELRLNLGFERTKIILADVADAARIRAVFSRYRPHIVFHSAAHKHVPIVENNVCEAVKNNIFGTHVVALAAAASGVAKFVLLSTDKAVNPASIMGATKRVAELVTQSFRNQSGTEFVTVRFGNVLGSRGSVIPIFKRQIEQGGPITITHREMQRYFMTIPEAVSLVLLAMAIGRDGQILVLNMGDQVRVLQLAEKLIALSGLTPYKDIQIVETGIRPGEKLYEEILSSSEGLTKTSHEHLMIGRSESVAYDRLAEGLRVLEESVQIADESASLHALRELVPSFQIGSHHFERQTVAQPNGKAQTSASNPPGSEAAGEPADGKIDSIELLESLSEIDSAESGVIKT
ncbi:MAG TPA: polysaccharide biosynthesis protein [Candidatus Acidoferrales bacterium]|nr:polysaccharide biosynthesis protein [Candidatus Acidoferrales bacterium]